MVSLSKIVAQRGRSIAVLVGIFFSAFPVVADSAPNTHSCTSRRMIVGFRIHNLTNEVKQKANWLKRFHLNQVERRRKVAEEFLAGRGYDPLTEVNVGPNNMVVEASCQEVEQVQGDQSDNQDRLIEYTEPDQIVTVTGNRLPGDQLFRSGWYGQPDLQDGYTGMSLPEAWATTIGSDDITVGVVDTGIWYNHEDLNSNMYVNPGEIPGDGIDNDHDGYIDNVYGWDFVNNDSDPVDDHFHGSHVAGTIGAATDNGIGIAGVNWKVKLMALKVLDANGSGWYSNMEAAIYYAINQKNRGAADLKVLNFSLGGAAYSESFKSAISAAGNAGIFVVAAAGNSASNNDSSPFYPAAYNTDNLIAVAATGDRVSSLASFSNYGPNTVHVAAPGEHILSTEPYNLYGFKSGTSMAAPHVSGLAALMYSVNQNLTPNQVRDIMIRTSSPRSELLGKVMSGGMVNAAHAVDGAAHPGILIKGLTTAYGSTPLSSATINGGPLGTVASNVKGEYVFSGLSPNQSYTLTPSMKCMDFTPVTATGTVGNSDVTVNFDSTPHYYKIDGYVTDKNGNPLEGVDLTYMAYFPQRWTTGANGYYYFWAVCDVDYTINLSKSGYAFPGISSKGTKDERINFSPFESGPYTLSGKTVASNGYVIGGVTITLTHPGESAKTITSDGSGNYSVPNVYKPDSWTLKASKDGWSWDSVSVTIAGNTNLNLTAQPRNFGIYGTIYAVDQEFRNVPIDGGSLGVVYSDSTGHFAFRNVPYGTSYSFRPVMAGYTFDPPLYEGTLLSDNWVNFNGTPGKYQISGSVFDNNGKPVSGARVSANGAIISTDSSGHYLISNIEGGSSYSVAVSKAGCTVTPALVSGTITQNVAISHALVVNNYNLAGRITSNGKGVAGVSVSDRMLGTAKTDINGNYQFSNVRAMTTYSLSAALSNYTFSPAKLTGVIYGDVAGNFEATANAFTVSGTVSASGSPLSGVRVDGGALGVRVTGADGKYSFNIRNGAKYKLVASKIGFTFSPDIAQGVATDFVTSDFSASTVAYRLTGQIKVNGKPLAGVSLTSPNIGTALTDANGIYVFNGLSYGTSYKLVPSLTGYTFKIPLRTSTIIGNAVMNFAALASKYPIHGVVRGTNGTLLSKVKVSCTGIGATLTNARGAYSINNVELRKNYSCSAIRPGMSFRTVTGQVTGDTELNFSAN